MAAARCNRRSHTKACRRAMVLGKFFVCNAHATRVIPRGQGQRKLLNHMDFFTRNSVISVFSRTTPEDAMLVHDSPFWRIPK